MSTSRIRGAIVGYGPAFNWGWVHARWLQAVPEMEVVAICDRSPECAAKARQDFPDVAVFTDLTALLQRQDIDLVAIVTPHNTHAALAIQCLQAGKHTVVEKPMCITIPEATAMVDAARRAERTLAVFHNRRHDGNVRAIRQVVDSGEIGEVFHIEVAGTGHGGSFTWDRPGEPWRASKAISGGGLYDWGAHAVDWVLSMVPSRMTQVTGFFHRFGPDTTNEDQTRAIIRFENGCVAEIIQSRVAYYGRPYLWLILGTKGAIVDSGHDAIKGYCQELNGPPGGSFRVRTAAGERELPYLESDWATYYADLADHLLRGAPVPVSAEDGRRVITVLQTAEASSRSGRSEAVPFA
jgi:predicted dehydrogenase